MKHITLGTNKLDVSRLGLGCMGMSAFYSGAGQDDPGATRTINRATGS
jgi:aryl-alcohol dehydrogenase-like predicted oxidoreductase